MQLPLDLIRGELKRLDEEAVRSYAALENRVRFRAATTRDLFAFEPLVELHNQSERLARRLAPYEYSRMLPAPPPPAPNNHLAEHRKRVNAMLAHARGIDASSVVSPEEPPSPEVEMIEVGDPGKLTHPLLKSLAFFAATGPALLRGLYACAIINEPRPVAYDLHASLGRLSKLALNCALGAAPYLHGRRQAVPDDGRRWVPRPPTEEEDARHRERVQAMLKRARGG
jgi:hypothetical protein